MITSSRLAVARALWRVFEHTSRVPEDWDEGLTPEDAALAQALLGQTLRKWGRVQAWFDRHLKDPARGVPLGTRVAASLGLVQLAWLSGVSTHAAVHESVSLAAHPKLGFPPHKGLVNAVLRKASADRQALAMALETLDADLDRSDFVEAALIGALGPRGQTASLEQLWARLQSIPTPTFRSLAQGSEPEGLVPDTLVDGAWVQEAGAAFPREWLASGSGMAQDRSSQALMAFHWPHTPDSIADLCAAPGGKTTALALRWPQAALVALEQDARRARRLQENLMRRRVHAQVVVADALAWLRRLEAPLDLILLDAPCSASGTLQKHPELTWVGDSVDLPRLIHVQESLLEAAISRLAPGGLLIYAVCSWFTEEGFAHRERLLARHPELKPAAIWPAHLCLGDPADGCFQPDPLTWPGEGFQGFAITRA